MRPHTSPASTTLSPSTTHSTICICNLSTHTQMHTKWLDLTGTPRLVSRTLGPRPEKVSPCVTQSRIAYQPAQPVGTGSRSGCDGRGSGTAVGDQFADMSAVESQLLGHCRSSAHNHMPRPGSRVNPSSGVWNAFVPDTTRVFLRSPSQGGGAASHSQCASGAPPPKTACVSGRGSAQTRSPFMADAPDCQPLCSEQRNDFWNSSRPCENTEAWRWNDHPYMLDTFLGVRRCVSGVRTCSPPTQDPFMNSTKRKLTVKY